MILIISSRSYFCFDIFFSSNQNVAESWLHRKIHSGHHFWNDDIAKFCKVHTHYLSTGNIAGFAVDLFTRIIEKSYLLALKQSKENVGSCIMQERTHQAKMVTVILEQIGPRQNRCLAFSTFTFKQGQNTKNDQINHFRCILYTFTMHLNSMLYIQYILVMVYTHFNANKGFFRDYSTVDQQVSGCI